MNEEIRCIINKGKTAKNEWENDHSDFLRTLYSVYKKLEPLSSILHSLHIILLEVINILNSK